MDTVAQTVETKADRAEMITLQEKVARLESLEQTKLQRENCVLHGKVGELEKRLGGFREFSCQLFAKR